MGNVLYIILNLLTDTFFAMHHILDVQLRRYRLTV